MNNPNDSLHIKDCISLVNIAGIKLWRAYKIGVPVAMSSSYLEFDHHEITTVHESSALQSISRKIYLLWNVPPDYSSNQLLVAHNAAYFIAERVRPNVSITGPFPHTHETSFWKTPYLDQNIEFGKLISQCIRTMLHNF